MISGDILRGHTETIILHILTLGDNYGYEISKFIIDASNNLIDIKDATIYTAFRRMEAEDLIATYWGDGVQGARRRYYKITEKGLNVYNQKKDEWKIINKILNNLILGEGND
ncbi:MAG: PadR family transcriptional regulator [Clostridia bacterium]